MNREEVKHVLILNGWSLPSQVWDEFLQEGFESCSTEVLSLDQLTCIEEFNKQISARIRPGTLLIGWSLGGEIALDFLTRVQNQGNLQNVLGVVFLQSTPRFIRADSWPTGVSREDFDTLKDLVGQDCLVELVRRFTHLILLGSRYRKEDRKVLSLQYAPEHLPSREVLNYGLELLDSFDLRQVISNLSVPSIWILGERDSLISLDEKAFDLLCKKCSVSSMHVVRGMGHFPCARHAGEVKDSIFKFVEGL